MTRKSNPSVVRRFRGTAGKHRLAEAFLDQPLLCASMAAATALSRSAKLSELPAGYQLMTQGDQDNDIYFILSGSVRVLVNSRELAIRRAGEHVGEMALIDRTAVRSATVVTVESSVVARVSENDFAKIANRYPVVWRKIAGIIAQRLRERNRFHPAPRSVPAVFIGSSSESLSVATAIYKFFTRKMLFHDFGPTGCFSAPVRQLKTLWQRPLNQTSRFSFWRLTTLR